MNQSVVLLMGANSQLTLVLLNSCFLGPLFPAPKEAWYAGWSCNHIQGQLALPGSESEVIPIDTAELSKLEGGGGLSIALLLSVFLFLGNRDWFYVSQRLSRS